MMKPPDKDKCLDQLISRATEGNEHRFTPNFDKWLKDHPDAVQSLTLPDDYTPGKTLAHRKSTGREPLWTRFPQLTWVGGIAALILIVVSCTVSVLLARKVLSLTCELELARQDVAPTGIEESTIINIYAREHRDVVARHASLNPVQPEPMQMRVSQDDILYYELLDDQPETMRPGIIVRGPSSQGQISTPQAPVISNGHTLSLSEAKETANFDLVAPSWLHPYFGLDQIRTIEDRDALHLLYTNGTHTISLFEQPLDGRRGLKSTDFREYAVYRTEGQVGGAILAWRDDALSYVLIGNIDMSQLMNVAQSISDRK
jgi:hypothetical protein